MKIIKNINNNYALAIDKNGEQVLVSGKGIGFGTVPREIEDLSEIGRTFYDVNPAFIHLLNNIPKEIIDISGNIIEGGVSALGIAVNPNLVFTLADHINFAIQRYQKNMKVTIPILRDIEQSFPKETLIGEYALNLIKSKLKVYLPKEEALYIAMHIINAEYQNTDNDVNDEEIIEQITEIVENMLSIKLDKKSFNYSRFATHISYLLARGKKGEMIESPNAILYNKISKEYPHIEACVNAIETYFYEKLNIKLTSEENLYLMVHINRICTREDCNQ